MHGMHLNFSPGKSEAIVKFAGKGSQRAQSSLHHSAYTKRVRSGNEWFDLRLVKCYKHLGTKISLGTDMSDEITVRTSAMNSCITILAKALRNPRIDVGKKVACAQAYILSKGTFQCGT